MKKMKSAIREHKYPLVAEYGQASMKALALMLAISLSSCAAGMTRDDLLKQMQLGTAPLIVDVRSQGEYDRDHVPGAVHIPFYAVSSGLEEMKFPKDAPVVLYCEHGPRSGFSGFLLHFSGYEKIYSLEGHMKAWRQNQFPIETIAH
jgi:rhodanese-related sulfurtransferase